MINTLEKHAQNEQLKVKHANTRVLFLLPVIADARFHKRIEALTSLGLNVEVLAFERPYYAGTAKLAYTSLGKLNHSQYFKRILPLFKALPIIRNYAKLHNSIYCFGLDILLLAWLVRLSLRKPITLLYEVGDIREVLLGKSLKSRLARGLESFLVKKADLLILTSQAYYDHFYKGMLNLSLNYQIIENKLEEGFIPAREPAKARYFMGYFGVLRCPRSWEIMNNLAEAGLSVYIRGFPRSPLDFSEDELKAAAASQSHLSYEGSYLAPAELPDIYGQVELVWACYPYEENRQIANSKWARTNRFYEACYFKKPMICQAGTEDARVVEALHIGMAVDLSKPEEVVSLLKAITEEQMDIWRENLNRLPKAIYMYDDEHEILANFLLKAKK